MADATVASDKRPIFRGLVASATLIGSFLLFVFVASGHANLEWKDVVLMIVGATITNFTTVVNWYFGSSEDSSKKTELLTAKKEDV